MIALNLYSVLLFLLWIFWSHYASDFAYNGHNVILSYFKATWSFFLWLFFAFQFFCSGVTLYVSVVIWHSSVGFFWVYASLLWSYNGFMCQFYALFVDNLCTSLVILCLCCLILTIFEALSLFKAILWSFSLIVITLW